MSKFGASVSHEDLQNLLFLAADEIDDLYLTESLDIDMPVLPHTMIHLPAYTRGEALLSDGGAVEVFRATSRSQKQVLIRVHKLAFFRKDCDTSSVIEQMRRMHCQIALKYIGFKLEPELGLLTVVYEDPGVSLLQTMLAKQGGRLNASVAAIRKMFLRFAKGFFERTVIDLASHFFFKGLLWLDRRKDFKHLQVSSS